MIKNKILVSMLIIALLSAVVTGATMSVFKDSAEDDKKILTTGTLDVLAGGQTYGDGVNLSNMVPGDVISGSFQVKNNGSLELWYDVTPVTDGSLFENLDGKQNQPFVTFTENERNNLQPGETITVKYNVTFPQEAESQYCGAEGDLSFRVDAVQTKNHDYTNYFIK